MSPGAPSSLASIVRGLLGSMDAGGRILQNMALFVWADAVGPTVSGLCVAEQVRDGVLYVRTPGSVWSQELSLMKHEILPRLNSLIGTSCIRDIKFRVGPRRSAGPRITAHSPGEAELAEVELTAEDEATLARMLSETATISDGRVREAFTSLMTRACRLNRWRLTHGWHPCPTCGAPVSPDDQPCSFCEADS